MRRHRRGTFLCRLPLFRMMIQQDVNPTDDGSGRCFSRREA
jgi:hypothetical protein